MNPYKVYLHIKLDTGEPFYVGKGRGQRPFIPNKRSSWWYKTVNKHGFDVIILEDNLTNEEAFEKEIYWIARIGRQKLSTGPLINLTDGGEGASGNKQSAETIEKRVKHIRGKSLSTEVKLKIGLPQMGKNNHYAKKIIHITTNITFNTIKEAATHFNVNYSTLRRQLNKGVKNPQFKYKED